MNTHILIKEVFGSMKNGEFTGINNQIILYTNGYKYSGSTFNYNRHGYGTLELFHSIIKKISCEWDMNIPNRKTLLVELTNGNKIKKARIIISKTKLTIFYENKGYEFDIGFEKYVSNYMPGNGLRYSGYILEGVPEIYGALYLDNKLIYKGEFASGLFNGIGSSYMKDKIYVGGFDKSNFSGYGELTFEKPVKNIISISGIWKNSKPICNSVIKLVYYDNKIYEGNITEDYQKNGVGTLIGKNMSITCKWINEKIDTSQEIKMVSENFEYSGYCEYNCDNKIIYTGFGKLKTDIFEYEGQFKNGLFSGYGKLTCYDNQTLSNDNKLISSEYDTTYDGYFCDGKAYKKGNIQFKIIINKINYKINETVDFINNRMQDEFAIITEEYNLIFQITDLQKMTGNLRHESKYGFRYSGESYKFMKHGKGFLTVFYDNKYTTIYTNWINDVMVDNIELNTKNNKYIGKVDIYKRLFYGKRIDKKGNEITGMFQFDIDFY